MPHLEHNHLAGRCNSRCRSAQIEIQRARSPAKQKEGWEKQTVCNAQSGDTVQDNERCIIRMNIQFDSRVNAPCFFCFFVSYVSILHVALTRTLSGPLSIMFGHLPAAQDRTPTPHPPACGGLGHALLERGGGLNEQLVYLSMCINEPLRKNGSRTVRKNPAP